MTSFTWTEKYRPKTLDQVSHQPGAIRSLKKMIFSDRYQHIMFYGPSGTGKTTVAKILTHFGSGGNQNNVLELNASNERGIDAIREHVKTFANIVVAGSGTSAGSKWKYVILDECDSLTHEAQAALRRIMEMYICTTRFFLLCNYKNKMIAPIISRCASFRFKLLPTRCLETKLQDICQKEQIDISPNTLKIITDTSCGDLRKAITLLQTCSTIANQKTKTNNGETKDQPIIIKHITSNHVDFMINGRTQFKRLFDNLLTTTNRNFIDVQKFVKEVISSAIDIFQVLVALQEFVLNPTYENTNTINNNNNIKSFQFKNDNQKAVILLKIAEVDSNLTEKANPYLQLLDLLSMLFM